MTTGLMDIPLAKKKMGRPAKGRNDVTARLDAEVARKAKAVAGLLGKTLGEYLSDSMGPIVDRDLKRLTGKLMGGDN